MSTVQSANERTLKSHCVLNGRRYDAATADAIVAGSSEDGGHGDQTSDDGGGELVCPQAGKRMSITIIYIHMVSIKLIVSL